MQQKQHEPHSATHRLELLYQTYKYSSISTGKYEHFRTNWQNYHKLLDKTAD